MFWLLECIPERLSKAEEPFTFQLSDKISRFFMCFIQEPQDHLFMGKEQVPEDVKCGMADLVSFTNIFYRMGMQEISIQNGQDKAQAVR